MRIDNGSLVDVAANEMEWEYTYGNNHNIASKNRRDLCVSVFCLFIFFGVSAQYQVRYFIKYVAAAASTLYSLHYYTTHKSLQIVAYIFHNRNNHRRRDKDGGEK